MSALGFLRSGFFAPAGFPRAVPASSSPPAAGSSSDANGSCFAFFFSLGLAGSSFVCAPDAPASADGAGAALAALSSAKYASLSAWGARGPARSASREKKDAVPRAYLHLGVVHESGVLPHLRSGRGRMSVSGS